MIKYALVLGLLVVGVLGSPQKKEEGKKAEAVNTRGFFGGGHQGGGFGHQGGGFGGGHVGGGFGGGHVGGGFGGGHVGGGFGGGHVGGGFGGGHVGGGFGGGHVGGGFGGGFGQAPPATCQHWCKTPEGQAFCCKDNNSPSRPDSFRGGFCPAVRAQCPVRSHFGPPVTCSQHGDCSFNNRCCFDRCLGENVCKQALPHNPNFG